MSITLEPYQDRAVEWLCETRRGIVVAPAGSGKTYIAAASLDRVLRSCDRDHRVRIGWIANTREQVSQASKALNAFPAIHELADTEIACAAAQRDWSDCDVLVVDECHHVDPRNGGNEWEKQIETCKGAWWGFTATPDTGDEERALELWKFFDFQKYEVDRKETNSKVVGAKVIMLSATDPNLEAPITKKINNIFKWRKMWMADHRIKISDDELWGRVAWQVCMCDAIVKNKARNAEILNRMQQHKDDPTLVLVNQVKHGEAIVKKYPQAILCHSKIGIKARREAMESFKSGLCKCLIATSLADEGLDLPMARVLILASGGRSDARTEQRSGRVLRRWADKKEAIIYDFEDSGHALIAKHARVRQDLYRKLGYKIVTE